MTPDLKSWGIFLLLYRKPWPSIQLNLKKYSSIIILCYLCLEIGVDMKSLRIGIVGASGVVGREFLKLLKERKTPVEELKLFSSSKSAGNKIRFRDQDYQLEELSENCFQGLDLVFFSAGGSISKIWAPKAVEQGAFAIDNSSIFRMDPEIPLIVPEVNPEDLPAAKKPSIIANPNCSTIQLVVALKPLQDKFGLKSVQVSTYQSVSGAGSDAIEELKALSVAHLNNQKIEPSVFPKTIAFNNLPIIGTVGDNGFTDEEMKMVNESKKILHNENLDVSAFCVRTPTLNGHSESVWIELNRNIDKKEFMSALQTAAGIQLLDGKIPTNRDASGQNPVLIGRVRKDISNPYKWIFWCVADNIRKGAALNGLQIAEAIFDIKDN